jgi:hypothetical protein
MNSRSARRKSSRSARRKSSRSARRKSSRFEGVSYIPNCKPDSKTEKPCTFSGLPIYPFAELDQVVQATIMRSVDRSHPEFMDWMEECSFFILKKGTVLCHSTKSIININEETSEIEYNSTLGWWKKTYPGQTKYKGAWFTFETNMGGPEFNTSLYYKIQEDIPILYIPNTYTRKLKESCDTMTPNEYFDCKTFSELEELKQGDYNTLEEDYSLDQRFMRLKKSGSELDSALEELKKEHYKQLFQYETEFSTKYPQYYSYRMTKQYAKDWSSSHIIPGVKYWERKGYPIIDHSTDYADDLGLRLATMGFFGYISCDECEVFLSHSIMEKAITYPFKYNFQNYVYAKFISIACTLIDSITREPLTFTSMTDRLQESPVLSIYEFELEHLQSSNPPTEYDPDVSSVPPI